MLDELQAILLIMLGGMLGALARYGCQRAVLRFTALPGWVAIMAVNILGSVIIGFAAAWIAGDLHQLALRELTPLGRELERHTLAEFAALVVVGFCGAYTTFSTFSLDNVMLWKDHKSQCLVNMIGTTILAFVAVALGWHLGGMVASA